VTQTEPHATPIGSRGGARGELWLANAPVSYGAFEITVGIDPNVPNPIALLDAVAGAGYAGIDLGPAGYLGTGELLSTRLSERGLALAGGYLELPFSEPAKLQAAMSELDSLLDLFDGAGSEGQPPRPTLADAGSPARAALPGRAAIDPSVGLDDAGWERFADGLAITVARSRQRGYEPTFHHHTATYVEAQWEIERMLELSDVGLCLDTGHLLLGRGDPVSAIRAWGERINQLHLKDARMEILEQIVAESAPVREIWARRAFCPLGEGDIDIEGVLAAIAEIGYGGWLVVEQDVLPDASDPQRPVQEQRRNREYLRAHGL
jgi:inosose dehydratase